MLAFSDDTDILSMFSTFGVLAQLARASRWQREGQEFKSPILHQILAV